jgi:hypothetical protein
MSGDSAKRVSECARPTALKPAEVARGALLSSNSIDQPLHDGIAPKETLDLATIADVEWAVRADPFGIRGPRIDESSPER